MGNLIIAEKIYPLGRMIRESGILFPSVLLNDHPSLLLLLLLTFCLLFFFFFILLSVFSVFSVFFFFF